MYGANHKKGLSKKVIFFFIGYIISDRPGFHNPGCCSFYVVSEYDAFMRRGKKAFHEGNAIHENNLIGAVKSSIFRQPLYKSSDVFEFEFFISSPSPSYSTPRLLFPTVIYKCLMRCSRHSTQHNANPLGNIPPSILRLPGRSYHTPSISPRMAL